jgi:hypothetical protein
MEKKGQSVSYGCFKEAMMGYTYIYIDICMCVVQRRNLWMTQLRSLPWGLMVPVRRWQQGSQNPGEGSQDHKESQPTGHRLAN